MSRYSRLISKSISSAWPSYVGYEVFEDVVRQGYQRIAGPRGAPLIEEWGRWAGKDRDRQDIELDVVARTLNGAMLTGSAKFRQEPASATMLTNHVDALRRLAASGYSWAEAALEEDAPLLMVSSAGFKDSFHDVAEEVGQPLIAWTLADLLST